MTKLSELRPHWIGLSASQDAIGVTFECPHCRSTRIGVFFDEPVRRGEQAHIRDFGDIPFVSPGTKQWHREGETFETLTLSPSIDTSSVGHWHGFITNGEVR